VIDGIADVVNNDPHASQQMARRVRPDYRVSLAWLPA
jgi:hypothetical protein